MASFWSKRINMRIKRKVAKDLGVEEEKVQELIDGKRHIGGETMDKVLQSINDEEENRVARDLAIMDWYCNTNLKELREEWGYKQVELAKKLDINSKTLNAVEAKYIIPKEVTKNMRSLYEFYQNEFNKKVNSEQVEKPKDEVLDWYNNTDLSKLREEWGYSQGELAKVIGINPQTFSAIEKHRMKKVSDKIRKLYEFYQDGTNKRTLFTKFDKMKLFFDDEPIISLDVSNDELGEAVAEEINKKYAMADESNVYETSDTESEKAVESEYIVIKIDSDGNIIYSENGVEISNITEIHLNKIGDEKPTLDVKLRRNF